MKTNSGIMMGFMCIICAKASHVEIDSFNNPQWKIPNICDECLIKLKNIINKEKNNE